MKRRIRLLPADVVTENRNMSPHHWDGVHEGSANREKTLRVRLNREEVMLIERLGKQTKRSKSDIVREGIRRIARDRVYKTWLQDAQRTHGSDKGEPKFEGRP